MAQKLNDESIEGWLENRDGWKWRDDSLVKEFGFDSFRNSIVFVNRVASLADDTGHYPKIEIRHTTVRLTLTTQGAKGITEKDLEVAEQVDFATSAR